LNKKLYIQSYCKIANNEVVLNDVVVLKTELSDDKSFFKSIYNFLNLKYPKFFKMDGLSKLTYLASELILKDIEIKDRNIAIVFSNSASSLETDRKYQKSINDSASYFPSPSVFVYTLPNIGIGEVSIRHQLKSENAFFVFEKFNAKFNYFYESNLMHTKKATNVLGGWTNLDGQVAEAFVYLLSENGKLEFTIENLNKLYKK